MDQGKAGLQYPDWDFDGDDIVMLLRIGFNQADTFHNSNCIGFSRIKNFRSLIWEKHKSPMGTSSLDFNNAFFRKSIDKITVAIYNEIKFSENKFIIGE